MEKRFYLGIGILAVCLILGFVSMAWMDRTNLSVAQDLEQAVKSVQAGDFPQGIRLAQQAQDRWRSRWKGIAAAADHSPMDEIDGLFAQMTFYAEAGQTEDFGACCARLGELVGAVAEAHRLTWWNLL